MTESVAPQPGTAAVRTGLFFERREQIVVWKTADERPEATEYFFEDDYVLLTVLGHCPHSGWFPAVNADPKFPAVVVHFFLLSKESGHGLKSIIKDDEIPFRLSTRVYVMNRRERRHLMKHEPCLEELPVEAFSVMSDYAVGILQHIVDCFTDSAVIVHVGVPRAEVPCIYAMSFFAPENLPASANDTSDTGFECLSWISRQLWPYAKCFWQIWKSLQVEANYSRICHMLAL